MAIRVALKALSDACCSLLPRLLKCTSSNFRYSLSPSLSPYLLLQPTAPSLLDLFTLLAPSSSSSSSSSCRRVGSSFQLFTRYTGATGRNVESLGEGMWRGWKRDEKTYYRLHFPRVRFLPPHSSPPFPLTL